MRRSIWFNTDQTTDRVDEFAAARAPETAGNGLQKRLCRLRRARRISADSVAARAWRLRRDGTRTVPVAVVLGCNVAPAVFRLCPAVCRSLSASLVPCGTKARVPVLEGRNREEIGMYSIFYMIGVVVVVLFAISLIA